MKKTLFLILFLGTLNIAKAQMPEIFTDLYIEPMKFQQYKNYIGYERDNYFFYTGEGKESL